MRHCFSDPLYSSLRVFNEQWKENTKKNCNVIWVYFSECQIEEFSPNIEKSKTGKVLAKLTRDYHTKQSQSEREKTNIVLYHFYVTQNVTHELIYKNRNRLRRGKRFVVVKGRWVQEGQDQEFGINRGKTVYIGWINGAKFYCTGQCPEINHNCKECAYMCKICNFHCNTEINTVPEITCTSINCF